jgi:L-ascorbate metabolism protein UlaG (beta-lactamase superfamily)
MMSLKGTHITWLGHATVLVQTAKGTNILIDPFIAQNPKYPNSPWLKSGFDAIQAWVQNV